MDQEAEFRSLTPAQQARRQRVMDAAQALGIEGGYEAVQMRDVAARASVALGTVYRYFASKDELLAEVLVAWVQTLQHQVAAVPPTGATAAARVGDVLHRALRAMARKPKLAAAVCASMASSDPGAMAAQRRVASLIEAIFATAAGEPRPADFSERARMIGHVWYSSLVGWINGATEIDRVGDEVTVAVRLLLPGSLSPDMSGRRIPTDLPTGASDITTAVQAGTLSTACHA